MSPNPFLVVHFQFQRHVSGSDASRLSLAADFWSQGPLRVKAPRFWWDRDNSGEVMGRGEGTSGDVIVM
jgi:hypothetical protein